MGIETEYGITLEGSPGANPMLLSNVLINAYVEKHVPATDHARWDYATESPLRDARGFDLARGLADPSLLTDENFGLANAILRNGARLYVDHAHPEYSSPEVLDPSDAARWDQAGDRIMSIASDLHHEATGERIVLYKNNTDGKGASYGCHENYLVSRATPFAHLVRYLTPFFVSRQVICGAGRVGIGQNSDQVGFQISQRADFFEAEVGLETTIKRPIINTRDEPHANPEQYRRLHVIIGDANMSEISTYLKLGTTALVLSMIEDGYLSEDLSLRSPVSALRAISHDPTLKTEVRLKDGRSLTAIEIQRRFLDQAVRYVDENCPDHRPTKELLSLWSQTLIQLETDPMSAIATVEWVAKLYLLSSYQQRDGSSWSDPKLGMIDLQWSDLRPERNLFHRLAARGLVDRLHAPEEIAESMTSPPTTTRAWFRGQCVSRLSAELIAASWDSVILDLPDAPELTRVSMPDPYIGGRDQTEAALIGPPSKLRAALADIFHLT
ncbi:depupylase [mine drainage metagenome]|uniref:Depupylase n=1 Tax=mine drainage metagenome TaxID=410659 RepID=A0A1J5Q0A5_9ZZZZ